MNSTGTAAATGTDAVAIGNGAKASKVGSIVIGAGAATDITGNYSLVFGNGAYTEGFSSTVIGTGSQIKLSAAASTSQDIASTIFGNYNIS